MSDDKPRSRALLTSADRRYIAGGDDVSGARRYQAISRVRGRIQHELPKDIEILEEHHPELLEEFVTEACEGRFE